MAGPYQTHDGIIEAGEGDCRLVWKLNTEILRIINGPVILSSWILYRAHGYHLFLRIIILTSLIHLSFILPITHQIPSWKLASVTNEEKFRVKSFYYKILILLFFMKLQNVSNQP